MKILEDIQESLPRGLTLPFEPADTDRYYSTSLTVTIRRPGEAPGDADHSAAFLSDQFNVFQIFNVPRPKLINDRGYAASY